MQTQSMTKAPSSQTSILPPLQNLPSWSRSSLERRKLLRPLVRDHNIDNSIEDNEKEFQMTQDQDKTLKPPSNGLRTVSAPSNNDSEIDRRVLQMEKSLEFVQHEHAQVLENLHKEIEKLKLENKELNFKLVMSRSGVSLDEGKMLENKEKKTEQGKQNELESKKYESKETKNKSNHRNSATSNSKKSRAASAKPAVSATPPSSGKKTKTQTNSGKSSFLTKVHARQLKNEKEKAPTSTPNHTKTESTRRTPQSPLWSAVHGGQKMFIVTLNKDKTMQVHVPTETGPRSPTLSECKTIIAEQQETNFKQAKELLKLRADLREAITSQKWNPNSYIVGKAVGKVEPVSSSLSAGTTQANRHLPRLPFREPASGRLFPGRGPANPDKVSLPSLRPNINSVVADRRRRQQAILRGRMARKDFC